MKNKTQWQLYKYQPNKNPAKLPDEPTYHNLMSARPVVTTENNSKKSKMNKFLNDKNESMPSWVQDEIREREKLQNPDLYNHGFRETGMAQPDWDNEDGEE